MTPTVMWEASAAGGRTAELLARVLAAADPAAQVYRSVDPEPRVVVIDPTGRGVLGLEPGLLSAPPRSWLFDRIDRAEGLE